MEEKERRIMLERKLSIQKQFQRIVRQVIEKYALSIKREPLPKIF
jgi:hypothetical protein